MLLHPRRPSSGPGVKARVEREGLTGNTHPRMGSWYDEKSALDGQDVLVGTCTAAKLEDTFKVGGAPHLDPHHVRKVRVSVGQRPNVHIVIHAVEHNACRALTVLAVSNTGRQRAVAQGRVRQHPARAPIRLGGDIRRTS
eukprot:2436871-Rhodomonas_salina.1